jgi:hypothetical protein
MSKAGRSLAVFAVYLTLLGAGLVLAPMLVLGPFGVPEPHDVWIRVVGMLCLFLAGYYFVAARYGWREFIQWTVYFRGSVVLFFGAFVALGFAPPVLLVFALVDLLAAAWTAVALRADAHT